MTGVEPDVHLPLREEECELRQCYEGDDSANFHRGHLLSFLEPEVLERFGSVAVEARCGTVVSTARREVALSDPRGGAVAG
jgi:hypothetical protein